jgi:hypothetical protein
MNLADYGPKIPENMTRIPAFRVSRWSLVRDPNSEGAICLSFSGRTCADSVLTDDVLLLLACDQRTGDPISCTLIRPDNLEHEPLPLEWLPGIVEDIARSAVLDTFAERDSTAWLQSPTPPAS